MAKKMIFSVPGTQTALQIVDFLKARGLGESDISVLGNEATEVSAIPEAGEFHNDVIPAAKRGLALGGATGLLAGLGGALVAPGLVIGGAALALATAGGATFGVLASSLIGSSVPNSQIRKYEQVLERGELLMIVDIDDERVADITEKLRLQHPTAAFMGEVEDIPPIL